MVNPACSPFVWSSIPRRPNYIRSINRAAEVTAIFEYESQDDSLSREFSNDLKLDISGFYAPSFSREANRVENREYRGVRSSLKISIKGFGLGLNADGASSLQAQSMEDFRSVMQYSFQSMQQVGVGMVRGMEIVAWVDNPQFQVAARISEELRNCSSTEKEENKKEAIEEQPCPIISVEIKKMALATNAEHVAAMNNVLRKKQDTLHNLVQCRSQLFSFPKELEGAKLVNQRKFTKENPTVKDMKGNLTVDVITKYHQELKDYVDKYYTPCINALTKEAAGTVGGQAMITTWYSMDECKDVTCTVPTAIATDGGKCDPPSEESKVSLLVEQYCMPTLSGGL